MSEQERVVAVYPLDDTSVRLGFMRREPVFLAVYDSGRVAAIYRIPEADLTIELASVPK